MSADYSIYGSGMKEFSGPVDATYSSNVEEVKPNKRAIKNRIIASEENPSAERVAEKAHQIVESMGPVEPPLGEAITGTVNSLKDNLSPYLLAPPVLYGLHKLWQSYSNNKPPNDTPPPPPPPGPVAAPQAPAAAPQGPMAPPATPVEAAVDPIQQAKLDSMKAAEARAAEAHANDQRRKDEAHASKLAKQAQQAEGKKQTTTSSGGVKPEVRQMLNSSENAKIDKAAAAQQKAIAPPAPAPTPAPAPVAAVPESTPAVPPAPVTEKPTKTVGEIPEGRISAYANPKRNKQGKDVIGQGGWHWYQGQMGPEAEKNWLSAFGRTNQSYEDVKQAMKEGRLKGPDVVEGKGGAFPRETHVPNYVRGSSSIGNMKAAGMTSVGAALALPTIKEAMDLVKQGEYTKAANALAPLSAVVPPLGALVAPLYTSPEEIDTLKKAEQARKVGSGRGVAPPSSYRK